jgi:hypothetical protein
MSKPLAQRPANEAAGESPERTPRGVRLFLWLFVVVGVIALGCGAWNFVQSLRCAHWPVTEGVIRSAEMERHSDSDGGDTYSASLSYDYQVADVSHTGTRWAFGAMSASSDYARRILNRYPVGKRVTVHYAPDDPSQAVLETGVHGGTWVCFGVGTVFVLVAGMFLGMSSSASTTPSTSPAGAAQQPPILMGIIFVLMGSFVFFMEPSAGVPRWIVYVAGGIFVLAGLFLLAWRLKNEPDSP